MNTLPLSPEQAKDFQTRNVRIREAWISDVNALAAQVAAWSEQQGWSVQASDTEIGEEATIGTYHVPKLQITMPTGQILLEPVGRGVLGADGRVDLIAWPSYFRVMLLRKTHRERQTDWIIRTESGLDWPHPWSAPTFNEIAIGLTNAA